MQFIMAIRKSVNDLTGPEINELVQAILAVKATGFYDTLVNAHSMANMTNIHGCPAFLPWHRQLLLELEAALQAASGNPDLGIPYWDWGVDAALSDPKDGVVWDVNFLGGDGDSTRGNAVQTGAFRAGQWVTVNMMGNPAGPLMRQLGIEAPRPGSAADIAGAIAATPYDQSPFNRASNPSFRNRLEGWYPSPPGLHNLGHVFVGGSMLPMTSPNDPIFFLHHCMVDKVWHDWQVINGTNNYEPQAATPFQGFNDTMWQTTAAGVTPASVMDIAAVGYSYQQPGAGGSGSGSGSGSGGSGSGSGSGGSGSGSGSGSGTGSKSRCFIATAAYDSDMTPEVMALRQFRDNVAQGTNARKHYEAVFNFYYRVSPPIADAMHRNRLLKGFMKYTIVYPALGFVRLRNKLRK